MERRDALGRVVRHPRCDERSPIAALDGVALDAEAVLDERPKARGHARAVERLIRRVREPVAGKRRNDHLMTRLDEERDQALELEHRTRPAVDEHDRLALSRPDEVDAFPGRVLELVQPALGRPPVVIGSPVLAQAPQESLIHPVLPADVGCRRASVSSPGARGGRRGSPRRLRSRRRTASPRC